MNPHHVCHLESTVCQLCSQLGEVKRICENKDQDLEKQLYLAHSETAEAQTGSTQNSKLRTLVISQTRNTGCGSPTQSVKDEKEARICEMEAKLSKLELEKVQLASLQFAECQCIMQCQEQEAMHCWLQHTLDKLTKLDILKEEPLQDLKRILQELTSSDSELPSVDLSSHGGRKSPLTTIRMQASQPMETSEPTSKRLQNKMESLQNLVESSQIKNQAMSPMIRTQEVKTKKCKEKERKLSK